MRERDDIRPVGDAEDGQTDTVSRLDTCPDYVRSYLGLYPCLMLSTAFECHRIDVEFSDIYRCTEFGEPLHIAGHGFPAWWPRRVQMQLHTDGIDRHAPGL